METAAPLRDVRREYVGAMRILTPKQRQWIRALPAHGFRRWSACYALKFSTRTLATWLKKASIQRALALQREVSELDHDTSLSRIVSEYAAMAFSNAKQFVGDDGKLKTLDQLDSTEAAAVIEFELNPEGKAVPSKLHPKKPALDALVEIQRLGQPKRVEMTGKDGAPLMPELPSDLEIARRMLFLLERGAQDQTPSS
jgi:hypothetical protein